MPKIRNSAIAQLHQNIAQACKDWTPEWGESSFSDYVVKCGIDHLFQIGDLDGVRERLLNLYFFGRLYELVDYPPILLWLTVLPFTNKLNSSCMTIFVPISNLLCRQGKNRI